MPTKVNLADFHHFFRLYFTSPLSAMIGAMLISLGAHSETAPLDVSPIDTSGKPQLAIPSLPGQNSRTNVVNGKVQVNRVELKGISIFPEYGVTQEYISQRLNAVYQQMESWMSISDMHRLADSLTTAYHDKGLTFNQVIVVPNEIRNNTLVLSILPGRVTEITLKNNKLYSERQIKTPFLHLLGKVVYEPDIQNAMKQANLIPGLKVFGFFSVGKYPGQVRLNLHVISESRYSYGIRMDNFGVEDTGALRVIGFYEENNLSGWGDTLRASLLTTNESGNLYGALSYSLPYDEQLRLGGSLAVNQYEVFGDFSDLGLNGRLYSVSAYANQNLLKEDNAVASFDNSLSFKLARESSEEFPEVFEETTDYFTYLPRLTAIAITPDGKQRQALSLSSTLGYVTNTDDTELNELLLVVRIGYDHELRWQPGNPKEWVTSLHAAADYAPDVLPDSERQVLTGAYGVRSYKPALFSADSVYSLKLDHSFNTYRPLSKLRLLPYVFTDFSYGVQNYQGGGTASFLGGGVGIQIQYRSQISGQLSLGIPFQESFSQDLGEVPTDPVVYGYININF